MTRMEDALRKIESCSEVMDMVERFSMTKETVSMIAGWMRDELATKTEVVRLELQRMGRTAE